MGRFILDRLGIRRIANAAAEVEVRIGARRTVNRAKVLAPVDTGRLRSSIRYEILHDQGTPRARVFSDVDYAQYVHDGTRPHIIRPRRKQALRFQVGGQIVFAKYVNHPGTRARPFLEEALRQTARSRSYRFRRGGVD